MRLEITADGPVYHEVTPEELALQAATEVVPTPAPGTSLNAIFENLEPAVRAQFYLQKAAIRDAIATQDYAVIPFIIQSVALPADSPLIPIQQQMLEEAQKLIS